MGAGTVSRRAPTFGVVFDVDGVLVRGKTPVPGARDVLTALHATATPFAIMTNGGGLREQKKAQSLSQLLDLNVAISSTHVCLSHTPMQHLAATHGHDLVLAVTSHLPHLIAYTIVGTASDLEEVTRGEVIKYSASGFRDFTRLAASDPTMWRDVCLHNKDAILEMLARFSEDLSSLQRAIRWGHGEKLFDMFTRTRAIRRSIINAGQETAAPDFGRPHEAAPVPDTAFVREHGGGDDA